MDSFSDLALGALLFVGLAWLQLHPCKCQRERAQRTQELNDWDWRA